MNLDRKYQLYKHRAFMLINFLAWLEEYSEIDSTDLSMLIRDLNYIAQSRFDHMKFAARWTEYLDTYLKQFQRFQYQCNTDYEERMDAIQYYLEETPELLDSVL